MVGIEVKLSNNHPVADICDTLAGFYPKEFKFTRWHPFCRCHAISILKTEAELLEDTRRIMAGQQPLPLASSVNVVLDVPAAFTHWVCDNAARIEAAEKRGTLPYFIKDNAQIINCIINPPKALTPKEIATQRYVARTPEDEHRIRLAWQERKERIRKERIKEEITSKTSRSVTPLTEKQKVRKNEIKEIMVNRAHAEYQSKLYSHKLTLPNKSVREWLNQPHVAYNAKNEALLNLQQILNDCKTRIEIPVKTKHSEAVSRAFALPIKLDGKDSWIIIHEMKWGEIKIYGISEDRNILKK